MEEDFIHEKTNNNVEEKVEAIVLNEKIGKKGTLDFFINRSQIQNKKQSKPPLNEKSSPNACLTQKINRDIVLSKSIPTKLGIRKALSEENIDHVISDVAWHVIMYNEVIIQIYDPKALSKITLLQDQAKIPERTKLAIAIFDFVDFQENFGGEKQLLKRKIKSYENDIKFKIIFIDNYEELYFIMKNIVKDKNKKS